jgi:hypothetical protein
MVPQNKKDIKSKSKSDQLRGKRTTQKLIESNDNRSDLIMSKRLLITQKSEEEAAKENTTDIQKKALLSGVKNVRLYEVPRIFMIQNVVQAPGEKDIIRCCFTANEVIERIISHMNALIRDNTLLTSSSESLIIRCYNNPNTDEPGTIVVSFKDAFFSDGRPNAEYYNQVLLQIRRNSSVFNQLPQEHRESILSKLEESYTRYTDENSYIRRVQAYSETNQKLTELKIDPQLESYLTSLISGYEDELKDKDINDYVRWLNDANEPGNSLNNLERTNLYLQTTFSQIERLFSIDMYHIIISTLESHYGLPKLTDIQVDETGVPDGSTFSDVLKQINDIPDNNEAKRNLNYIYKCYFLLKSLCFILHDKPVNAFVETLHNFIVKPMQDYSLKSYHPDVFSVIVSMIVLWENGFKTGGGDYKASQKRCHNTASNLTTYFNDFMKQQFNIIVPGKLLVYSMPYSVFRNDESEQNLVRDMLISSYCKYGLADAVGNDFVQGLFRLPEQQKIFTLTSALQDAAPPSRTNGPLTVIKEDIYIDTNKVAINRVSKSTDAIDLEKGISNLLSLQFGVSTMIAEPVRFGNIAIFTLQNTTAQPFVLYYLDPAVHFPGSTIEELMPYLVDFVNNLNTSWTDIFTPYTHISDYGDEGKTKILFGVSYGRISQNDTIPLIGDLLDMSKSSRGRGPPANIITLKWLEQGKGTNIEETVRVLLASFAKELGDQAKRNVVEIINRDPNFDGKGLLATVDTFLPHAFTNGICVVKAGNIEIYEQEGFRTIDRAAIIHILKILEKYNNYGLLKTVVTEQFLPLAIDSVKRVIGVLTTNIQRPDLSRLPNIDVFKHILLYYGILSELYKNRLLIDELGFHSIETNYKASWQSPGFIDDISFMKRILLIGNIRELFAIYEKDIDTNQSFFITYISDGATRTEKALHRIIDKYYRNYYEIKDFDFDTEIDKIFEEAPLFYLLKYWNDIINIRAPGPPRGNTKPEPSQPPNVYSKYIQAVANKLTVFISNYIATESLPEVKIVIKNYSDVLVQMVNGLLTEMERNKIPPESSFDDSQYSQVEILIDNADDTDAQNIVEQSDPGVSVVIEETGKPSLIDPSQSNRGGKPRNKNTYINRKLTKKLHRSRKTRKITKRATYLKKNGTKHRR